MNSNQLRRQDQFFVVTEGWERVRIGRPCGRGQLHEARTGTQTTKSAPEWPAEQARFTRRRTINEPWLRRWLKKRGCTFHSHKGGSGHLTVQRGNRTSQLPMHGSRRELGPRLIANIKKDLGSG